MTWKEFKEYVESKGVADNSKIDFIDVTEDTIYPDDIIVCIDFNDQVSIYS